MIEIIFTNWFEGFQTIQLAKLINNSTPLGFKASKKLVDSILENRAPHIVFEKNCDAEIFYNKAKYLGVSMKSISQNKGVRGQSD